jgi:hypothetical protein
MSTERKPIAFGQFGGLRLDVPIDEVPATQAIDCLDVDWEGGTDGALRPRDGAVKITPTDGLKVYANLWRHSDARLVASREGTIVDINTSGEVVNEVSGPLGGAAFSYAAIGTPSASYTFIGFSTAEAIRRYDGSTFTTPKATVDGAGSKAMPAARYLSSWPAGGNRLVLASTGASGGPGGAASSGSHVWFSEPGLPESFESTAYVQVSPGDGEEITAVVTWGGQVFVFKRTKLFVFYGVSIDEEGRPIFNFREVALPSAHFGSVLYGSQRAVATSDGVYFVCQDGVYVTTGGMPAKISGALLALNTPRAIPGPAANTFGSLRWLDFGQLFCFRSRLYLVSPSLTLVFDLERGEWLVWKTVLTSMVSWNQGSGGPDYLYFGYMVPTFLTGRIYKFDPTATTDPTVTMEPRWQSGFYDLGNEDEKVLVETKAWGTGTIGLEVFSDLSSEADASSSDSLKFLPVSQALGQARSSKAQRPATFFSHKLTFGVGSRIQRLVRYLEVTLTPTTKSR